MNLPWILRWPVSQPTTAHRPSRPARTAWRKAALPAKTRTHAFSGDLAPASRIGRPISRLLRPANIHVADQRYVCLKVEVEYLRSALTLFTHSNFPR